MAVLRTPNAEGLIMRKYVSKELGLNTSTTDDTYLGNQISKFVEDAYKETGTVLEFLSAVNSAKGRFICVFKVVKEGFSGPPWRREE